MKHASLSNALSRRGLSRRHALWLLGASVSATSLSALQGCAQSPVTGERILVGMSEAQERATDAQQAPHQFSEDLGAIQDPAVNRYVSDLGRELHTRSHRPDMPYNYRVLNANYVNAYTFPAGAMGVTRGILVAMQDEAELAALLASYSRDNEREADALGQAYMVRGGYPANGMVRLHQLLLDGEKQTPSLLQTMFSSHPMSTERVATAERLSRTRYANTSGLPTHRERFMDSTASVRRIKPTIEACQRGETAMSRKQLPQAQTAFAQAIKATPTDYAAHVRMAQCLQAMGKPEEARAFAQTGKSLYPEEAQAQKISGVLALQLKQPQQAYEDLTRFEQTLPGDPGITFLRGVALEGSGNRQDAALLYRRFLQTSNQGQAAQYAASRLQAWDAK